MRQPAATEATLSEISRGKRYPQAPDGLHSAIGLNLIRIPPAVVIQIRHHVVRRVACRDVIEKRSYRGPADHLDPDILKRIGVHEPDLLQEQVLIQKNGRRLIAVVGANREMHPGIGVEIGGTGSPVVIAAHEP